MITQLTSLVIGAVGVGLGAILGYFARQSIAKKQIGTLEERIEKRTELAKQEAGNLVAKARQDST